MYTFANFNRNTKTYQNSPKAPATIVKRLKQCRNQDGYTIKEIAAYLRKSPSTISRYENGLLAIPYKDLVLLTLLYFYNMDYFCEPLYKEYQAQSGSAAAFLIKYARYSNKFYNAHIYFPTKSEQEAITIIAGYTLFPLPRIL